MFGLRSSAAVELLLFLGVALILDVLVFQGDRYRDVSPHPFWIPVLLLSFQYGTGYGLLAAFWSSVALLAWNVPPQKISQSFDEYLLAVGLNPLLWFTAAIVVGDFRLRQLRTEAELRERLKGALEERNQLADAYEEIKTAKIRLEARIASQINTVYTLSKAAQGIERLAFDEVIQGAGPLIRATLDPDKFSIFLKKQDSLVLAQDFGWAADDPYQRLFAAGSPFFDWCSRTRDVLCVVNEDHARLLQSEGVLAGVLADPETGDLLGVLKIEQLDFLDLNLSFVENFRIVCDWLSSALASARRYEEASATSYYDPRQRLYTANFLAWESKFLEQLADRSGFDVCAVVVQVSAPPEGHGTDRIAVGEAVSAAVSETLRATDQAFDTGSGGQSYVVLLPGASEQEAKIASERLLPAIRKRLPESLRTLAVSIHVTGVNPLGQDPSAA